MIMEIYSVKDKQVDAFLQPFFSPTLGAAVRSLTAVVADANHEFAKNTSDFTLYRLGSFDDATGSLTCIDPERITPLTGLKQKAL